MLDECDEPVSHLRLLERPRLAIYYRNEFIQRRIKTSPARLCGEFAVARLSAYPFYSVVATYRRFPARDGKESDARV